VPKENIDSVSSKIIIVEPNSKKALELSSKAQAIGWGNQLVIVSSLSAARRAVARDPQAYSILVTSKTEEYGYYGLLADIEALNPNIHVNQDPEAIFTIKLNSDALKIEKGLSDNVETITIDKDTREVENKKTENFSFLRQKLDRLEEQFTDLFDRLFVNKDINNPPLVTKLIDNIEEVNNLKQSLAEIKKGISENKVALFGMIGVIGAAIATAMPAILSAFQSDKKVNDKIEEIDKTLKEIEKKQVPTSSSPNSNFGKSK
jgi:hypothetical protein